MFKNIKIKNEDVWRSLILFGDNSATYKFSFAKTLLALAEAEKTKVILDDLVEPYSNYLIEHIKNGNYQGNGGNFLTILKKYSEKKLSKSEMLSVTKSSGFNYVINAFQNINGRSLEGRFYEGIYTGQNTTLILKDELFLLKHSSQYQNLLNEVEARWRLVETAWSTKIPVSCLVVKYNEDNGELYLEKTEKIKRVSITSARDALSGYQNGKCFYCNRDYSTEKNSPNICHVDHFLPNCHKGEHERYNLDGVWNLVLACSTCNGTGEKGQIVPNKRYLVKLHNRNESYIRSSHPLAETIINQTGSTNAKRVDFLKKRYNKSLIRSCVAWSPTELFQ